MKVCHNTNTKKGFSPTESLFQQGSKPKGIQIQQEEKGITRKKNV